jgi:hypothetical protein
MKLVYLRAPRGRALPAFFLTGALVAASAGSAFSQPLLPVYQNGSGKFVVDYEIGGDIDRADFFYLPTDLALDSRGNLFVLDLKGYCIKKFDPDGHLLGTFGRKGEGPGEIDQVTGMDIDLEDRLILYDFGNNRFSVFANTGVFVKTAGVNAIGWRSVLGLAIDRRGRLYIESERTREWGPRPDNWTVISRLDLETMTETPVDSASFQSFYWRQDGETSTGISAPYCPGLFWGVAPSGDIVIANSADYSIRIFSSDFTLRREIRPERKRKPVTNADKEEYFSEFEGENLLIWMRQTVDFPKYMPCFDRLLVDDNGYLLFLTGEPSDSAQVYEVFTPDAEFLNRVSLPRLHPRAVFDGRFIYTVARGEDDPVVRRYRLE